MGNMDAENRRGCQLAISRGRCVPSTIRKSCSKLVYILEMLLKVDHIKQ